MLDKVQKLNNLKSTKGLSYPEVQNSHLTRPCVTLQACCLEVRKYQATWQECEQETEKLSRQLHEPPPLPLN